MKRSQISVEFIIAISIMFFIFVGFIAIISTRMIELQEEKYYQSLASIGEDVAKEIRLASIVENGYQREFRVPLKDDGLDYNITFYELNYTENRNVSVLMLYYENFSLNNSIQINLPYNVRGKIYKGYNNITKEEGVVCLNVACD